MKLCPEADAVEDAVDVSPAVRVALADPDPLPIELLVPVAVPALDAVPVPPADAMLGRGARCSDRTGCRARCHARCRAGSCSLSWQCCCSFVNVSFWRRQT